MISKELFTQILTEVKKQNRWADQLDFIFREMKNDFIQGWGFMNEPMVAYTIQLLDMQFGEDCDWVQYWVYELACGDNAESMQVETPDGHYIKLETIDDLWNWCIEL